MRLNLWREISPAAWGVCGWGIHTEMRDRGRAVRWAQLPEALLHRWRGRPSTLALRRQLYKALALRGTLTEPGLVRILGRWRCVERPSRRGKETGAGGKKEEGTAVMDTRGRRRFGRDGNSAGGGCWWGNETVEGGSKNRERWQLLHSRKAVQGNCYCLENTCRYWSCLN